MKIMEDRRPKIKPSRDIPPGSPFLISLKLNGEIVFFPKVLPSSEETVSKVPAHREE